MAFIVLLLDVVGFTVTRLAQDRALASVGGRDVAGKRRDPNARTSRYVLTAVIAVDFRVVHARIIPHFGASVKRISQNSTRKVSLRWAIPTLQSQLLHPCSRHDRLPQRPPA